MIHYTFPVIVNFFPVLRCHTNQKRKLFQFCCILGFHVSPFEVIDPLLATKGLPYCHKSRDFFELTPMHTEQPIDAISRFTENTCNSKSIYTIMLIFGGKKSHVRLLCNANFSFIVTTLVRELQSFENIAPKCEARP